MSGLLLDLGGSGLLLDAKDSGLLLDLSGSELRMDLGSGLLNGRVGSGARADVMPKPISGLLTGLDGFWLLATISGVGLLIDLLGSGLKACLACVGLLAALSGVGLLNGLRGSGLKACLDGIGGTGLLDPCAASFLFLGALTVDVVDVDRDTEVLMYFSDLATRAAGSGAVGSGFIGERGGLVEHWGLGGRESTLYLLLVGLEGTYGFISSSLPLFDVSYLAGFFLLAAPARLCISATIPPS